MDKLIEAFHCDRLCGVCDDYDDYIRYDQPYTNIQTHGDKRSSFQHTPPMKPKHIIDLITTESQHEHGMGHHLLSTPTSANINKLNAPTNWNDAPQKNQPVLNHFTPISTKSRKQLYNSSQKTTPTNNHNMGNDVFEIDPDPPSSSFPSQSTPLAWRSDQLKTRKRNSPTSVWLKDDMFI